MQAKAHIPHYHNQKHVFFIDLHANRNYLRVIHECTVHAQANLGTRYTPTNTSKTQVTRVHAGEKSNTQVYSPLSTGALWHPRGINHRSINLSGC